METIDKVDELLRKGETNRYVAEALSISESSVRAYKANITKRRDKKLEGYAASNIVIPYEALEKLDFEQLSAFTEILDTLIRQGESKESGLERKVSEGGKGSDIAKPLPASEVREIIIELREEGFSNREIYGNFKLRGVSKESISAYLAHYSRGTYDKPRE